MSHGGVDEDLRPRSLATDLEREPMHPADEAVSRPAVVHHVPAPSSRERGHRQEHGAQYARDRGY